MNGQIELKAQFGVAAEKLYRAWLDPVHHAAMSYGGEAQFDAQVGGHHSSGDGYITGTFRELEPGRRLVFTWRTTDFAENQPDSLVELKLADTDGGCELTLVHTGLPDDQVEQYKSGWVEFYLDPMKRYFGG